MADCVRFSGGIRHWFAATRRPAGIGDARRILAPLAGWSAPLSEIPDFYPPVHRDAASGDLEGNLWILPTTSAQSRSGELVYDVVSPKRGLFARVRMPVGRSIVGFGRGGVLYLQSGDRKQGFRIERVKVEVKADPSLRSG